MLKDSDKYRMRSHFSYIEDSKKVKTTSNKDLKTFVSVFFIGIFFILGIVKIMSPNVDVGITNNDEIESHYDSDESNYGIDKRLQNLKKDDDGINDKLDKIFSPELDERVIIPQSTTQQTTTETSTEKLGQINIEEQNTKQQLAPIPQKYVRVFVGNYSLEQQAIDAKNMMLQVGINNAIIKNIGGKYTIQVGTYSTMDKAQQVASELIRNNINAYIVE